MSATPSSYSDDGDSSYQPREAMPLLWCLTQAAAEALSERGVAAELPMLLLAQLEMLDALATALGGPESSSNPSSSPSSSPSSNPSSNPSPRPLADTCAEARLAPDVLLQAAASPFAWLNDSAGARAARVYQPIGRGRAARWLRPLWNPRTFGARVELAPDLVDSEGAAALLPCHWASHVIPRALLPEACTLLDEAAAMGLSWWKVLEMKAAEVARELMSQDKTIDMPTDLRARCEPWRANEPCRRSTATPSALGWNVVAATRPHDAAAGRGGRFPSGSGRRAHPSRTVF